MIGSSPFIESLWIIVSSLETRLIFAAVFPAIVVGIAVRFLKTLDKN